jgi:aryl-alcohol dehydrogenase-like predicted oxidoreductase
LLDKSAHELQLSIDQLSLAAVFAQPWAHVVLSGATTVEQLQSNVTAASVQIPESIFKRLLGLRQHESAYWQSRQQLAWN